MNKIALALLLCSALHALHIKHSYEAAHRLALQQKKMLVVFLTKKECKACNRELVTFLQSITHDTLFEKNALFVIIIQGSSQSYPIEMLYTNEYPTLFFLDENELFACEAMRGGIDPKGVTECLLSWQTR